LRRQGFTVAQLRRLLVTLRDLFRVRLFETIGAGGPITLMTDGRTSTAAPRPAISSTCCAIRSSRC
jgi:hypothetical protein